MPGQLDGRVVLVTGGARGIGAAVARRFVAEGASVVIGDLRDDLGKEVAAGLGDRAMYVHLDVSQEDHWGAAVAAAVGRFGKLDGLVNNAGIFGGWGPLEQCTLANYLEVVRTNQLGTFLGMRAAVPELKRAGGGTIVNVSSGAGITGVPYAIAYVASKFAVTGMTKTAALELRQFGIRVNSMHPGVTRTPLVAAEGSTPSGADTTPGRPRWAEPEEMANVALFLTSNESSYCTGAELAVDLGVTAGPMLT